MFELKACPACGTNAAMAYCSGGGVVMFEQDCGRIVAVLGVPVWACIVPGCLHGQVDDGAAATVFARGHHGRRKAVRRFYGG